MTVATVHHGIPRKASMPFFSGFIPTSDSIEGYRHPSLVTTHMYNYSIVTHHQQHQGQGNQKRYRNDNGNGHHYHAGGRGNYYGGGDGRNFH
jgi:hypothetical protein